MDSSSRAAGSDQTACTPQGLPFGVDLLALPVWLTAAVVAFIPFARDTSPWNAITLHVPGNQGNWWHVLVGIPFFLAYPMLWIRLRSLFLRRHSTKTERRLFWVVAALSICGTLLVEAPFLFHLAGTSSWQRLVILVIGFGIIVASALLLFLRRHTMAPLRACMAALETAYLANAALCLIVYSEATGSAWSRAGWLVSMVMVWPIAIELSCLLLAASRSGNS